MTTHLPKLQTLWREKTSGLIFVVAMIEGERRDAAVIEPACVTLVNGLMTWSGTPDDFLKQFEGVRA